MLGGAIACGFTHAGITPLDVTKCNMQVCKVPRILCPLLTNLYVQVDPTKYKGLVPGLQTLIREEGQTGIWKGFGPTLVGYSLQGLFKYGLYEVFKDTYMNLAGEEASNKYKPAIWLAGSASAEVFADIALCPLEMTKVKIQTSPVGTFPTGFGAALAAMSQNKIETRYPFGSLVPLWSRQVGLSCSSRCLSCLTVIFQIPYTMAKFFFFEKIVQLFYSRVFTAPKESYSKGTQLGVTFASGYAAGVVCAIVSHPADSLVSLQGKAANKGKSLGQIAGETGLMSLATKGLGTRVLMIGMSGSATLKTVAHPVSVQEPLPASSGGSMTRSRARWVSARLVANRRFTLADTFSHFDLRHVYFGVCLACNRQDGMTTLGVTGYETRHDPANTSTMSKATQKGNTKQYRRH